MKDSHKEDHVTHEHDKKCPKILFRKHGTQIPGENKGWCYVRQVTKVSDQLYYTEFMTKQHTFVLLSFTH